MKKKIVGITWLQQRRMSELCAALGIELHTLVSDQKGARRYLNLATRTLRVFRERKPDIVIAQNPSMVLVILSLICRAFFRFQLVVDAHNEAVQPYANKKRWAGWMSRVLLRSASFNIVTNRWLANIVEAAGGRAFVMPDPLPVPPPPTSDPSRHWEEGKPRVVAIASYAPDEPIDDMIEAARQMQSEAQFAFTGNYRKMSAAERERAPANVRFTGFLNDDDYWSLLYTSDVIIDLTLMNNCLVSGAYEAVSVEKPAVLSDNPACRDLFAGAALFVDNSMVGIRDATRQLLKSAADARVFPAETGARMRAQWHQMSSALLAMLNSGELPARRT